MNARSVTSLMFIIFSCRIARCLTLLPIGLTTAMRADYCQASDLATEVLVVDSVDSTSSSYCGLHAAAAVAASLDQPLSPEGLFRPGQYLSSPDGSTVTDLSRALATVGLQTKAVGGLRACDLQDASDPALLMLEPLPGAEVGHWVAFLGMEGNFFRVFESSVGHSLLRACDLNLRWNGLAYFVAHDKDALDDRCTWLNIRFLLRRLAIAVGFILTVVLFGILTRNFFGMLGSFAWPIVCVATAMVVGLAIQPRGLPTALRIRECFADSNLSSPPPKTDEASHIRELPPSDDLILIDCRMANAFRMGTIPGAIHVPVNASDLTWQIQIGGLLSEDIADKKQVVVFCQSALCPWAEIVQRRLSCLGWRSKIYSGGYARYKTESQNFDSLSENGK